jgi:hypothetical protein
MNNGSATNAPVSGTTSRAAPPPPASGSTTDYLAHQDAAAKAAMGETLRALAQAARQEANAHPLLTLGGAAVAGALASRLFGGRAPATSPPAAAPRPAPPGVLAETLQPVLAELALSAISMVTQTLAAAVNPPPTPPPPPSPSSPDEPLTRHA